MGRHRKLELTWVGKDERPRLEPRILVEEPELSVLPADGSETENILIHGDNLLALKALEQDFGGRVKCVYIDPPYNTGSAFERYDDAVEHSLWLSLMRDRLEILWRLLTDENGTLLISINDDEAHYLKVMCDGLFGRHCFVASLVWNYEGNTDNQARIINYHEYVLVYSKTGVVDEPDVIDPSIATNSKLFRDEIRNTIVKNGPKNPPVPVSIPKGFPAAFESGIIRSVDVNYPQYSEDVLIKDGRTTNGVVATTGWSSRAQLERFIESGFSSIRDTKGQETRFEMTQTGAIEGIKRREAKKGHFVSVLRGFGTTNQMRIMLGRLGISFTYPKPVELIAYLIEAFTGPKDIVLDSFAGSGTTAHAVLQLNRERGSARRFIAIELLDSTVREVVIPRLEAVVRGNPAAGIDSNGGGFRFYRLAPSLLERDRWGNWVINQAYNAAMLSQAMCKHEGYRFEPNPEVWWIHGHATERAFIYVTTQTLNHEQLVQLSDEVGPERSLLICGGAFRTTADYDNLTLKKIPQAVLHRCEWGRDDYSLNIRGPLTDGVAASDAASPSVAAPTKGRGKRGKKSAAQDQTLPLFEQEGDA